MIPQDNSSEKISCWECGEEIIQYFEAKYGGTRGKCLTCNIDFPLD